MFTAIRNRIHLASTADKDLFHAIYGMFYSGGKPHGNLTDLIKFARDAKAERDRCLESMKEDARIHIESFKKDFKEIKASEFYKENKALIKECLKALQVIARAHDIGAMTKACARLNKLNRLNAVEDRETEKYYDTVFPKPPKDYGGFSFYTKSSYMEALRNATLAHKKYMILSPLVDSICHILGVKRSYPREDGLGRPAEPTYQKFRLFNPLGFLTPWINGKPLVQMLQFMPQRLGEAALLYSRKRDYTEPPNLIRATESRLVLFAFDQIGYEAIEAKIPRLAHTVANPLQIRRPDTSEAVYTSITDLHKSEAGRKMLNDFIVTHNSLCLMLGKRSERYSTMMDRLTEVTEKIEKRIIELGRGIHEKVDFSSLKETIQEIKTAENNARPFAIFRLHTQMNALDADLKGAAKEAGVSQHQIIKALTLSEDKEVTVKRGGKKIRRTILEATQDSADTLVLVREARMIAELFLRGRSLDDIRTLFITHTSGVKEDGLASYTTNPYVAFRAEFDGFAHKVSDGQTLAQVGMMVVPQILRLSHEIRHQAGPYDKNAFELITNLRTMARTLNSLELSKSFEMIDLQQAQAARAA